MFRRSVQLLFVLFLFTLCPSDGAIFKRPSRRESVFERNDGMATDRSMSEIRRELAARLKRAAGDPQPQETLLNDTNPAGLVEYAGTDSKVVFVLTYNRQNPNTNLYRSSDYGKTFTNINKNIGDGVSLTNAIYVSPEDPKTVYFVDTSQPVMYISTDEGVTFTKRVLSPGSINPSSLVPHPMLENWVLAHDPDSSVLYVSRDLGKTPFVKISDSVYTQRDYNWGEYPYDQDLTIVYYNTDDPNDNSDEISLFTQRFPYTEQTKGVFDPSLGPHQGYILVDRYIFVQKMVNTTPTLWVSVDRQPFKMAHIPSTFNHVNYFVDSVKSLQALVIVQHDNNQYNLYMSEEMGVNYYLALADVAVAVSNAGQLLAIDLQPIVSMNYTTHIANQFVRDSPNDANPVARTLISFDAGANWDFLQAPSSSNCVQPLCSLHLHMSSSDYWRTGVYSQASAPGIIIAHGITGQSLNNIDDTNLFISRDGGSTWSQTLDGTWGVSVLDLGGLIIAAKDFHTNNPVESQILMYTCDEGLNWSQLKFTNKEITVFAVITESGEATTNASLFGGITSNGQFEWIVVTIDFANAIPRVCSESSDYYQWTPSDQNTGLECLLGATITVERQKPYSCCRNGKDYNRVVTHVPCACTSEDFECDYGYKHANGYSGECIRDDSVTLESSCANGELTYIQSQGYQRIGGDVCIGGVESSYIAMEMACNNCNEGGSNATSIVLGCLVLVAVIVIVAFSVVLIVCFCKLKPSGGARGYRMVPPTDEPSPPYEMPPSGGAQTINYGDGDDAPLAP